MNASGGLRSSVRVFSDRLATNQPVWPDRRPRWSRLGWAAFGLGFLLSLAGWIAAFSVVGAVLLFAGAPILVLGLGLLLGQHPWSWVPLACLSFLLVLWSLVGVVSLLD